MPWNAPPPPKQNNTVKWMLGGIGILLIIAITVGITVLVTRDDTRGDGPTPSTGDPIASADDDGPIEIITLEPTCQAWMPVRDAMAEVQNNGWSDRDPEIPASEWTSEQRAQYEAVGKSLRQTADQAVEFARKTPNRVVRELYEQFIVYSRAYADSIPSYTSDENFVVQTSISASSAVTAICDSITYGSAAARGVDTSPIAAPTQPVVDSNPDAPARVVTTTNPTCDRLDRLHRQLVQDTEGWSRQDPNLEAASWSAQQQQVGRHTSRVLNSFSDQLVRLAPEHGNASFQDIASLGAIYLRAFSEALTTYTPADNYLFIAGSRASNVLVAACRAASS